MRGARPAVIGVVGVDGRAEPVVVITPYSPTTTTTTRRDYCATIISRFNLIKNQKQQQIVILYNIVVLYWSLLITRLTFGLCRCRRRRLDILFILSPSSTRSRDLRFSRTSRRLSAAVDRHSPFGRRHDRLHKRRRLNINCNRINLITSRWPSGPQTVFPRSVSYPPRRPDERDERVETSVSAAVAGGPCGVRPLRRWSTQVSRS